MDENKKKNDLGVMDLDELSKLSSQLQAQHEETDDLANKNNDNDDLIALKLKNQQRITHEKQVIELQKIIEKKPTGIGIASFCFGIGSLVLYCAWYFAVICSILGIIYGIWQLQINKKHNITKFPLPWIGIGLSIAGLILAAVLKIPTALLYN